MVNQVIVWVLDMMIKKSVGKVFDETIDYEYEKMKEVFIAGIMLGSGAYQLKKDFDPNEEFKKLYHKMFPAE